VAKSTRAFKGTYEFRNQVNLELNKKYTLEFYAFLGVEDFVTNIDDQDQIELIAQFDSSIEESLYSVNVASLNGLLNQWTKFSFEFEAKSSRMKVKKNFCYLTVNS
jgi:hypothetical protein